MPIKTYFHFKVCDRILTMINSFKLWSLAFPREKQFNKMDIDMDSLVVNNPLYQLHCRQKQFNT